MAARLTPDKEFEQQLDKTILDSLTDQDFMEKIRKLDLEARKRDITIYQFLYQLMYQEKARKEAAKWHAEKHKN